MEIRIRRRMTGRQLRDQILERYEERERVEGQAEAGNADAQEALFNLQLFDEDPTRLDDDYSIEDILVLDRNDLSKLTETRLRILEILREVGQTNVKELTARLQRDPKNVSRDVAYLESFGLIEAHRHGKTKHLQAAGNEIVISV
jgi:DNA-binding transcriptional ArsR family regulator